MRRWLRKRVDWAYWQLILFAVIVGEVGLFFRYVGNWITG